MNNLPIYNSTSDLTSKLEDILLVFIVPTLCLIGVFILKMITFRVLHEIIFKLKNNDIVYHYTLRDKKRKFSVFLAGSDSKFRFWLYFIVK